MKYYLAIDIGASSGRHIVGWKEDGVLKTEEVFRFPNGMQNDGLRLTWDIKALFDSVVEGIKAIVAEFPDALGIHDMIVHSYGPGRFVANLHIEVDGTKDIFESHDMIDLIEKRLNSELGILSNIHMDPIVVDDAENDEMRAFALAAVKAVDERMDIHDFRFVKGKTHTNLLFDITVPFEMKMGNSEITDAIQGRIAAEKPNHYIVVNIDRC